MHALFRAILLPVICSSNTIWALSITVTTPCFGLHNDNIVALLAKSELQKLGRTSSSFASNKQVGKQLKVAGGIN